MDGLILVAYVLLAFSAVLFMWRLYVGPTVVDRIIALDGVLFAIVGGVFVEASRTDSALPIDTVLVVSLLGFVATGVLARYAEQRGNR